MSRGEFGGSPSYGSGSSGNMAVNYGRPSRYQDGGEIFFIHLLSNISCFVQIFINVLISAYENCGYQLKRKLQWNPDIMKCQGSGKIIIIIIN